MGYEPPPEYVTTIDGVRQTYPLAAQWLEAGHVSAQVWEADGVRLRSAEEKIDAGQIPDECAVEIQYRRYGALILRSCSSDPMHPIEVDLFLRALQIELTSNKIANILGELGKQGYLAPAPGITHLVRPDANKPTNITVRPNRYGFRLTDEGLKELDRHRQPWSRLRGFLLRWL